MQGLACAKACTPTLTSKVQPGEYSACALEIIATQGCEKSENVKGLQASSGFASYKDENNQCSFFTWTVPTCSDTHTSEMASQSTDTKKGSGYSWTLAAGPLTNTRPSTPSGGVEGPKSAGMSGKGSNV
jgi:hypothetical protein